MFKAGDRVRIIENLEERNSYGSDDVVVSGMLDYAGTVTEVISISKSEYGMYKLLCDNGLFYWPERTLIPYAKTNGDKIRDMTDEELAHFVPCPYKGNEKYHACEKGCFDCHLDWIKKATE